MNTGEGASLTHACTISVEGCRRQWPGEKLASIERVVRTMIEHSDRYYVLRVADMRFSQPFAIQYSPALSDIAPRRAKS